MTLLFLFGVSTIGMKTHVYFLLTPMLLGVVDVIVVTLVALVIDVIVVPVVVCFVPLIGVM